MRRKITQWAAYAAAIVCLIGLVSNLTGCQNGPVLSNDPAEARVQLEQMEAQADHFRAMVFEADAVIAGLQGQLDQANTINDQATQRLATLEAQLADALSDDQLDQAQADALRELVDQARAQAEDAELIGKIASISDDLDSWQEHRDGALAVADHYSDAVAKQKAALDAGTGGTGLGATLQIAGDTVTGASKVAPPPARGYMELAGWALGAIGGVIAGFQTRKAGTANADALTAQQKADAAELERQHEAKMLDTTIASIEAAKHASSMGKIDFLDGDTKRVLKAVQAQVPELGERIRRVTSKVS